MVAETFEKLIHLMAEKKASDPFLTVGLPPCIKLNGEVVPISKQKLS
jgi:twitching motility protein PilU